MSPTFQHLAEDTAPWISLRTRLEEAFLSLAPTAWRPVVPLNRPDAPPPVSERRVHLKHYTKDALFEAYGRYATEIHRAALRYRPGQAWPDTGDEARFFLRDMQLRGIEFVRRSMLGNETIFAFPWESTEMAHLWIMTDWWIVEGLDLMAEDFTNEAIGTARSLRVGTN